MYAVLVLLGVIAVLAMPAFAETPSEQSKKVMSLDEISCSMGMTLIGSPTGRSACVFGGTVERMEQRGWTVIAVILPVADKPQDDEPKDDVPTSVPDMPHTTSDANIPAATPDGKSASNVNLSDDENDKEDDDKYLILGGRINLKPLETGPAVDPNPIKFPLTLEEAEAAMQRLADAFDDRVIHPPVLEDYRWSVYDTELGNTFEITWEFMGN